MTKLDRGQRLVREAKAQMARDAFFRALDRRGLPRPEPEHAFARPRRRWRLDYAWVEQRVGLEVDGGVYTGGRHTRGAGWEKDTEKLNTAAAMGWRILRTTPRKLTTTATLAFIARALEP